VLLDQLGKRLRASHRFPMRPGARRASLSETNVEITCNQCKPGSVRAPVKRKIRPRKPGKENGRRRQQQHAPHEEPIAMHARRFRHKVAELCENGVAIEPTWQSSTKSAIRKTNAHARAHTHSLVRVVVNFDLSRVDVDRLEKRLGHADRGQHSLRQLVRPIAQRRRGLLGPVLQQARRRAGRVRNEQAQPFAAGRVVELVVLRAPSAFGKAA
jgi:hypothetical protein